MKNNYKFHALSTIVAVVALSLFAVSCGQHKKKDTDSTGGASLDNKIIGFTFRENPIELDWTTVTSSMQDFAIDVCYQNCAEPLNWAQYVDIACIGYNPCRPWFNGKISGSFYVETSLMGGELKYHLEDIGAAQLGAGVQVRIKVTQGPDAGSEAKAQKVTN